MNRPRRRAILATTLALLLLAAVAVAGYVVGTARTPAQDAARAVPPAPSVLTMPVEKGPIVDAATLTATLTREHTRSLPLRADGGNTVVTRVAARAGDWVRPGSLLCDVSGRPLLVLPGAFPAYRDLKAGDIGPDVRQLQAGLQEAGLRTPVTGTLDPATVTGLTGLYARWGYRFDGALPAASILYASHLPARLTQALPGPGPLPADVGVHLAWGDLVASAPLTADLAQRWREARPAPAVTVVGARGTRVRLLRLSATPPPAAEGPGATGGPGPTTDAPAPPDPGPEPGFTARFALTPAPGAGSAPVRLQVVFARSSPRAVVVPVAALLTDHAGREVVTRRDASGTSTDVPVAVELAVEGRVAVVPISGTLKVGDDVVIGAGPSAT